MLDEFVEHHPAGTLRGLFEQLPKHGEWHGTEFSSRFKRWTEGLRESRLVQGEWHDVILL
jgi:hypothetical protein